MRYTLLLLCLTIILTGCRGHRSEKPPIHPNVNLDYNPKIKSQSDPQPIPDGTVAYAIASTSADHASRSAVRQADSRVYKGKTANGQFVQEVPIAVSKPLVVRGQERYNIYCAACHDKTGSGKTPVIARGFAPPPHLASDERLIEKSDGYLFDVISNGAGNMPGYAKQIPVLDRWAIVTYVRSLQKSQNARLSDVPAAKRSQLK